MVNCFVPDCQHRNDVDSCKFVRFPIDSTMRNKWIKIIRRADVEPNDDSRVCGCHFKDGNFSAAPSLFERNKEKLFEFPSPEKKKRRRRRRRHSEPTEEFTPQKLGGDDSVPPMKSSTLCGDNDEILASEPAGSEISDVGELEKTLLEMSFSEEESVPIKVTNVEVQTTLSIDSQTVVFSPTVYEAIIDSKDREIERLKQENARLKNQPFGYYRITNDSLCLHYTGVNKAVFDLLLTLCQKLPRQYYQGKRVIGLADEDQLLMTLMKLRLNSPYLDLGFRYGVSKSTAFNIVYAFLPVLHLILYRSLLKKMPSQQKVKNSLPDVFSAYPNCRVIVDCTEMDCQVPKNMTMQKVTYSSYKKRNTVKLFLGIAPNGSIVYCSDAYPGSTSDKEITKHCGIIEQLQTGDLVLADKGFLISDIMPPGVQVNIPPFLMAPQFTQSEAQESRNIARARCHVERANSRLKKYRILRTIPKSFFTRISMMIQVCAGLVNFENPLFKSMANDFLLNENFVEEANPDYWYED